MLPILGAILGAILPEPERSAIVRRLGGDPARVSGLLGATEFVLGAGLVHDSSTAYLRAAADRLATGFLAVAERGGEIASTQALGFTWGGSLLWLGWMSRPSSWLLVSVPLVGLARLVAWLTVREPVAEPAVWAAVRLLRLGRGAARAARQRADFGPAGAPDEVLPAADGGLVVLAARPRPEWNEAVTIGVGESFYRVARRDTPRIGGRRRHRYRLVPAPEHEVIRRLLRYEPPVAAGTAAADGDALRD